MPGGPPGVIAVVQRGKHREIHTSGVANLKNERRMKASDRMRIASTAKAFSGAVTLSLVSKGRLSLNDTIGERRPDLPDAWSEVSEIIAAGWTWASGGIVSTPGDLNTFIHGYVRGDLFDSQTRSQQREVFEGGGSEPPGPGETSAGSGVFRYETRCGATRATPQATLSS